MFPRRTLPPGLRVASFTALALGVLAAAPAGAGRDRPLVIGLPAPGVAAYPAEASRVHVVLLVDRRAPHIGAPCYKDVLGFRAALVAGFAAKRDRLVFHDLTGEHPQTRRDWTPRQVFLYLSGLQFGPNETLVVFHSGHGSVSNRAFPEETHRLSLNTGSIPCGATYAALRNQRLRAFVLLTDSCSSYRDHSYIALARSDAEPPDGRVNAASVTNLFLRLVGHVSIAAAQDGQAAAASFRGGNPGKAGSAFTVALLRLLYDRSRTCRTWGEIFPRLRAETLDASGGRHQPRAFTILEQGVPGPGQPAGGPVAAAARPPGGDGRPGFPAQRRKER
jgi:hypothetical protein